MTSDIPGTSDIPVTSSTPMPSAAPPDAPLLAGDPELRLLSACLRPLAAADRTQAIAAAAAQAFDADRLVALANRHRVSGFVEHGLAAIGHRLPDEAAARLAQRTGASRLQALRNAGEEIRVCRALAAAGIDAIVVKGSTLAVHAHGLLAIKTSWDIDLLVGRENLASAGAALGELGYRLSILGGIEDPVQIQRYLAVHKEAEWHNDDRATVVELHTELSDNAVAIPGIGLGSARMMVDLMPGQALATLAPAPLFAYLAFHGTTHLWSRLKWLADVAALLHDQDVEVLYRDGIALGAGRCPGVAIVLAHDLFAIAVPSALLDEIRADRATRRLIRYSLSAIAAAEDSQGKLMRPMAEVTAYARAQAWLVPGFAYRWRAVRRFVTQPYLVDHLRVPTWAMPIAILSILPVRLLLRPARLRRQAAGKTASTP